LKAFTWQTGRTNRTVIIKKLGLKDPDYFETGLIRELWNIARARWDDRNDAMHRTAYTQSTAEMTIVDPCLKQFYDNIKQTSRELDQYLTSETKENLLKKSLQYKMEWVRHATGVWENIKKRREEQHKGLQLNIQRRQQTRLRRLGRRN
jgi:hypothetical protein